MISIKICGITNLKDARLALEVGADILGFVFYPKSKRAVRPETVRDIIRELPPLTNTVGVFVNESRQTMLRYFRDCGLSAIQLSGNESLEFANSIGIPVLKTVPVGEGEIHLGTPAPQVRFLLDSAVPGSFGGSGQAANWQNSKKLARQFPLFLAGGLNPENIEQAVQEVKPAGVDVSSGVEAAPGIKSEQKLRAFISRARIAYKESNTGAL